MVTDRKKNHHEHLKTSKTLWLSTTKYTCRWSTGTKEQEGGRGSRHCTPQTSRKGEESHTQTWKAHTKTLQQIQSFKVLLKLHSCDLFRDLQRLLHLSPFSFLSSKCRARGNETSRPLLRCFLLSSSQQIGIKSEVSAGTLLSLISSQTTWLISATACNPTSRERRSAAARWL